MKTLFDCLSNGKYSISLVENENFAKLVELVKQGKTQWYDDFDQIVALTDEATIQRVLDCLARHHDMVHGEYTPYEQGDYWNTFDMDMEHPFYRVVMPETEPEPEPAIKRMVEPKKRDDLFNAMSFYIAQFEEQHGRTPRCSELWEKMKTSNLEEWDLEFNKNEIEWLTGRPTTFKAFRQRYTRYYP